MLLPFLKEPKLLGLLTFFLSDFRNGRLPAILKFYLLAANLLASNKDGSPKPRPIAVGEMFYRMVTAHAIKSLGQAVADTLLPIQLGVGVEGGVETATHIMNALLTDDNLKEAVNLTQPGDFCVNLRT